jgi:hypothetical protein
VKHVLALDNALMAGYEVRITPFFNQEEMQLHWLGIVLDPDGHIAFRYNEADVMRLAMKMDYDLLGTEL